jgi:hypothetical protein
MAFNSLKPWLNLDRQPDDPTQEEIAERSAEVRNVGFTNTEGVWCGPWSDMTHRERRYPRRRAMPMDEVGGIREVSSVFYLN